MTLLHSQLYAFFPNKICTVYWKKISLRTLIVFGNNFCYAEMKVKKAFCNTKKFNLADKEVRKDWFIDKYNIFTTS